MSSCCAISICAMPGFELARDNTLNTPGRTSPSATLRVKSRHSAICARRMLYPINVGRMSKLMVRGESPSRGRSRTVRVRVRGMSDPVRTGDELVGGCAPRRTVLEVRAQSQCSATALLRLPSRVPSAVDSTPESCNARIANCVVAAAASPIVRAIFDGYSRPKNSWHLKLFLLSQHRLEKQRHFSRRGVHEHVRSYGCTSCR